MDQTGDVKLEANAELRARLFGDLHGALFLDAGNVWTLRPLRKQITVNTVDAFQGQERDVVMVSLVRSNEQGQIGFLSDLRRMNVAITRARFKLIILGSKDTLCQHKFYKKLFDRCKQVSFDSLCIQ